MARAARLVPRVALARPASMAALAAELARIVGAIPASYLQRRRWFGSKTREIRRVALLDYVVLGETPPAFLALVTVHYDDAETEVYHLPLLFGAGTSPPVASAPILEVVSPTGSLGLYDALEHEGYGLHLLQLIHENARLTASQGGIACQATSLRVDPQAIEHARVCSAEQSNTSLLYDGAWIMKNFRKLEFGRSRDLEVGEFLSACTPFRHTPRLAGSMEYETSDGRRATLAVLQEFVPHQGDGWRYVLEQLVPLYRSLARERAPDPPELARQVVRALIPALVADAERLGSITGEMHCALGSRPDLPHFAPEPVGPADVLAWASDLRHQAALAFAGLRSGNEDVPAPLRLRLDQFLSREPACREAVDRLVSDVVPDRSRKIQIHGDYHLGQVLKTDQGFAVIDFEGEPTRPLAERRAKQSPLKDVAGMMRSFSYAANAGLRQVGDSAPLPSLLAWCKAWEAVVTEAFVRGYRQEMAGSGLVPESERELLRLARFFQVGKAFYELNYELNHRPDWVEIPLQGIERLLGSG